MLKYQRWRNHKQGKNNALYELMKSDYGIVFDVRAKDTKLNEFWLRIFKFLKIELIQYSLPESKMKRNSLKMS